ncbi:hypothetical protein P3274_07065 [Campylobacter jejuni]|nr:hypothetical protein P3274_07065 [Campylobacter jejuni]
MKIFFGYIATTPFINVNIYQKMYNRFLSDNLESMISVSKIQEYVLYKNKKLNFDNDFLPKVNIEPIYIIINGCFIF